MLMWCGLWLVAGQALAATATVSRLRVNAMENPVGIDSDKPSFSWTLEAGEGERGVWQTAYEIRLYTDQACQNEFWTSGKVESGLSVDRPYNGPSLQAASRYYWRVTVWDNKGREATSDEMAYFEMGLMNEGWSGAKWISPTTLKQDEYEITRYDVETDFQVENLAAGIIFAARSQDTYCMWQVNFEAGYPRFRPHVWTNGQASCLVEEDLRPLISLELHKTYHLRIEVDGSVARTYIDDVLIIFSALQDKDTKIMKDLLCRYSIIEASFDDERLKSDAPDFKKVLKDNWNNHKNIVVTGSLHFISAVRKYLVAKK